MMTNDPFLRTRTPVWNAADAGSGGAASSPSQSTGAPAPAAATGGAAASPAGDAGAAPATNRTYLSQMKPGEQPAAQAAQDPAGETQQGEGAQAPQTEAGQGEGGTDPTPAEFKLDVPQEYADFAPDFEAFSGVAAGWLKENPNATAADAFKFAAEYQAKRVGEMMADAQGKHAETVQKWETDARSDKEFGGPQFDQNLATAKKAIDHFATPELRQMLDETGVGNHPELIRAFYRAGKMLEEAPVLGTTSGGAKKSLAQALYGNS